MKKLFDLSGLTTKERIRIPVAIGMCLLTGTFCVLAGLREANIPAIIVGTIALIIGAMTLGMLHRLSPETVKKRKERQAERIQSYETGWTRPRCGETENTMFDKGCTNCGELQPVDARGRTE